MSPCSVHGGWQPSSACWRLEEHPERDAEDLDFSHYLVAVGLDYLSFRLPEIDWSGRTRLVAFHRRLMARPSFAATTFQ
jgi:glutathione S-transferase